MKERLTDRSSVRAAGVAAAIVFAIDLAAGSGLAAAILYMPVVLLVGSVKRPRRVWFAASFCTGLTIVGFLGSSLRGEVGHGPVNRLLSIVVLWVAAGLFHRILLLLAWESGRAAELEGALGELERQGDALRKRARAMTSVMDDLRIERERLEDEVQSRKRVESALEHSEEKFRSVVESAPNAILVTDENGTIVLVNREAERLFGYDRTEMLGRPAEMLVPEAKREDHPSWRRAYLKDPSTRRMGRGRDLYALKRDGSEIAVEIALNPMATDSGTFVLSSVIDITERKRSERKIRAYSKQLEETNADLEEFTYVASHDLREPLRKVTAFADHLVADAGDALPQMAREDLGFIVDGARRMRRLVEDLMRYSHAARSEFATQRVPLDTCVDEALQTLSMRIDGAGATVSRDPLPIVPGDAAMLTQVLQNLLGNALKFGGESPAIRITATETAEEWIVGVQDSGIGVDSRYAEQIFAPCKRLHNAREYEGSGMGLAICRRIVEKLGGRIWVESEEGRGAHFRFALPVSQVPSGEPVQARPDHRAGPEEKNVPSGAEAPTVGGGE